MKIEELKNFKHISEEELDRDSLVDISTIDIRCDLPPTPENSYSEDIRWIKSVAKHLPELRAMSGLLLRTLTRRL